MWHSLKSGLLGLSPLLKSNDPKVKIKKPKHVKVDYCEFEKDLQRWIFSLKTQKTDLTPRQDRASSERDLGVILCLNSVWILNDVQLIHILNTMVNSSRLNPEYICTVCAYMLICSQWWFQVVFEGHVCCVWVSVTYLIRDVDNEL